MNTHVCRVCGIEKPYEEMVHSKAFKNGVDTLCLACNRAKASEWQKNNPERSNKRKLEWGRNHPDRVLEANRRWQNSNPDKVRQIQREWRHSHPNKIRDYVHRHYKANAEKIRTRSRAYQRLHPEQNRLRNQKRRSRQNGLPDTFTAEDWQQALDYFGGVCAVCGRPPGLWHKIVRDHWIPIFDPGPIIPELLQPTSCHYVMVLTAAITERSTAILLNG